jgi:hypothetical protein
MTALEPTLRPDPTELANEVDAFLGQNKMPDPPRQKERPGSLPRAILPVPVAVLIALAGLGLVAFAVLTIAKGQSEDPAASYRFTVPTDGTGK